MPPDATLLKQQKNTLLQILVRAEFDPADFEWQELVLSDHNSNSWMAGRPLEFKVSKLVHRPSGYYVIFGGLNVIYSPGTTRKEEREEHGDTWEKRYSSFRAWLSCLRKEYDAPDLWASIGKEKVLLIAASSPDLDNTPFKADEQKLIAQKLGEIEKLMSEGQASNAEQFESIHIQLAYLREASERLGRKDWLNILLSVLISQIVNFTLPPEQARGLLALAGTLFQSLWDVTQRLLQ